MSNLNRKQTYSMNPRVIYNEAQDKLKLCPGDEEPKEFELKKQIHAQI